MTEEVRLLHPGRCEFIYLIFLLRYLVATPTHHPHLTIVVWHDIIIIATSTHSEWNRFRVGHAKLWFKKRIIEDFVKSWPFPATSLFLLSLLLLSGTRTVHGQDEDPHGVSIPFFVIRFLLLVSPNHEIMNNMPKWRKSGHFAKLFEETIWS